MTISIRLTSDEEARLEGLARRTGRSKSFYVRAALQAYLTDLEDAFAADTAIDAFKAGGRRSRRVSSRWSVETTEQFDRQPKRPTMPCSGACSPTDALEGREDPRQHGRGQTANHSGVWPYRFGD